MGQWMAPELWAACRHDDREPAEMWVLGLDGSATGDVTALVAVSVEETPHVELIDYWQPTEGNPVPVLDVEEAIRRACRQRQVVPSSPTRSGGNACCRSWPVRASRCSSTRRRLAG